MSSTNDEEKNSEYLLVDKDDGDDMQREQTPMDSDDGGDIEYVEEIQPPAANREDTVSIKSDADEETKTAVNNDNASSSTGTGNAATAGHARSGVASAPASNADVMSLFRVNSAGLHDRSSSATLTTTTLPTKSMDSDEDGSSSSDSDEDVEQQEQRNSQIMFMRAAQTWMSEKADLEETLAIEHDQLEDQRARGEYLEGQLDHFRRKLGDMEKEKDKYVDMYGKLSEQYLDLVTRHDELIEDRQIAAAVAANVDDGVSLHKNPSVQSDAVLTTHRRNRSRSLGDKELRETLVHSWSPQMGQFTLLQRELEMKTEQLDACFQKFLILLSTVRNLQTSLEEEGGLESGGTGSTSGNLKILSDRAAIRRSCIRRAFECAKVQRTMDATNKLLESYIRRYPAEGSYEIVENLERGEEYMYQLFYDELKETRLLCTEAFGGMNEKFEYFDRKMGDIGGSVSGVMSMVDAQSQVSAKTAMQSGSDLDRVQQDLSSETKKLRDAFASSLNELRGDLSDMMKRNDDLNGKLMERDREMNALRRERDELREELEGLKLSKCEAIRHVANEMDRLRSRIKDGSLSSSSNSSSSSTSSGGLSAASAAIKGDSPPSLLGTMASSLSSLWT